MRKQLLIIFFVLIGISTLSAHNEYREGEILVKFKTSTSVQMRAPQRQAFSTSQVNAVDALFAELGVDSVEQLMPLSGHTNVGKRMRAYNGSTVEVKDLSKLYRLTWSPDKKQSVWDVMKRLQALDEVEFAEPNYIVSSMALPYDTIIPTQDSATYVSEPLYSQQWGLRAINMPGLWNKPKKSSKRPVIAILDTGVDIEHPDLKANIWTNTAEANGISGQDDDGNGIIDDIHGYDFAYMTGEIADFYGHGTHCAGIAAAVGNNGIGITGANPDALIMPVTVMLSDGRGDIAMLIHGIDYAAANGADVISMSFGGYAYSAIEEEALVRAYSSAILVAAAGNDNKCIYNHKCTVSKNSCSNGPIFPAALSFVLGVEASQDSEGTLASFSNIDEDGPVYTEYEESKLYNYELRAPGVNIISTYPGGRYKALQGTSMACPMAAGAISRLIQCKEYTNTELLIGDLIHSRSHGGEGNIDISSAYLIKDRDRHPELLMISYTLIDSIGGDNDGQADAGETIAFYPILQNSWGTATNIKYWLKKGMDVEGTWVYGDTAYVTFMQDTAYFGKPLSSYAHAVSQNPFMMKFSADCPDGSAVYMTLYATCDNMTDTIHQVIHITIENGVEIGGMITDTVTLYPDVHYKVTRNLAVAENALLIIKPGTKLEFNDNIGLFCSGRIYAEGTPDSMIIFTKAENASGWKGMALNLYDTLGYCIIEHMHLSQAVSDVSLIKGTSKYVGWIDGCGKFNSYFLYQTALIHDAIIRENVLPQRHINDKENRLIEQVLLANSNVFNNELDGLSPRCFKWLEFGMWESENLVADLCGTYRNDTYFQNNNFVNNRSPYDAIWANDYWAHYPVIFNGDAYFSRQLSIIHGNWYNNEFYGGDVNIGTSSSSFWEVSLGKEFYMGSAREDMVRKHVYDFEHPNAQTLGRINLDSMATRPMADAHGIVWKILVNGYDAQDEFEQLPPLGVGTHRCDVYFNRPMDVAIAPIITFGVRVPYEQQAIAENGTWSADSTYYTAYFTIDAKTASDGFNTIKVVGAQDPEHFEIPEESKRFHMDIAAAGSMSTGLMAEAGLGKVTLTWETDAADMEDMLGYNIYRWTELNDTVCINSTLIDMQDSSYVDYTVVPGTAYYYVLRQVTTALTSYDVSNPVSATPLTSIKGDANGSMSVNVADVLAEIAYILDENPQPFIFEAADVNSDNMVNIYDVVGTVNMILNPQNTIQTTADGAQAYYSIENGILYVETDVVLGGVQVTLEAEPGSTIEALSALDEFERIGQWQDSTHYLFMAYSMSGQTLGIGKHALLNIGDATLQEIILSDPQGHEVSPVPAEWLNVENIPAVHEATKFMNNGHLYFRIGDRIYSATGLLIH